MTKAPFCPERRALPPFAVALSQQPSSASFRMVASEFQDAPRRLHRGDQNTMLSHSDRHPGRNMHSAGGLLRVPSASSRPCHSLVVMKTLDGNTFLTLLGTLVPSQKTEAARCRDLHVLVRNGVGIHTGGNEYRHVEDETQGERKRRCSISTGQHATGGNPLDSLAQRGQVDVDSPWCQTTSTEARKASAHAQMLHSLFNAMSCGEAATFGYVGWSRAEKVK